MSALIASFWPAAVGIAGTLFGVLFGYFRHLQASKKEAVADDKVQAANTVVAQKQSQLDTANAAVAAATEQSVSNRATADATAAGTDSSTIDAQLAAIGAERKE